MIRDATPEDAHALATLWHDGWHQAHARFAPPAYTAFRSLENFRSRVPTLLDQIRTIGPVGDPHGLHILHDNELYQFYVAAKARGTGTAPALMQDAEARIRKEGADTAFLFVVIQNLRAIRFYGKCGWQSVGTEVVQMPLADGSVGFELLRMEKRLF